MTTWLAVFMGGGIGSLLRYGLSRLVLYLGVKGTLPWATLAANVLATALLAWMVLRMQSGPADRPALRAFIGVGICGGFSTFSTFSQENFLLLREGHPGWALTNIAVNVLACLAVFHLIARST